MLAVTWEWIAIDKAALDVANTIAIEKGVEHDLLAPEGAYDRWADFAARSPELTPEAAAAITGARPRVLELRTHIRGVFHATAAGERLPRAALEALNAATRSAPNWPELDDAGGVEHHALGDAAERLLARYASSAMEIAAAGSATLRVCPAPSCGMFYRPRRSQQRWCSEPCGNRARFARHYAQRSRAHRPASDRAHRGTASA